MLLLASVLVAPHLTVYDLVIRALALYPLADSLAAQRPTTSTRVLGTFLYLAYMLPLLGPFARWTHVQPSVVAMALSVYLIWKISTSVASANARDDKTKFEVARQRVIGHPENGAPRPNREGDVIDDQLETLVVQSSTPQD